MTDQNNTTIPYGYCKCGCGEKTAISKITRSARGYRKGEPIHYIHGHHRRRDSVKGFWSRVDIKSNEDCWEWTGSLNLNGYGHANHSIIWGGNAMCHRVAYELTKGKIPEGLLVLHKCDNRKCVNPSHLFLGTQTDNMQDMHRKRRNNNVGMKGERNPNNKLTVEQVRFIRSQTGKVNFSEIARKFGVTPQIVWQIANYKAWKHVA